MHVDQNNMHPRYIYLKNGTNTHTCMHAHNILHPPWLCGDILDADVKRGLPTWRHGLMIHGQHSSTGGLSL
jgi:hypothetical protein